MSHLASLGSFVDFCFCHSRLIFRATLIVLFCFWFSARHVLYDDVTRAFHFLSTNPFIRKVTAVAVTAAAASTHVLLRRVLSTDFTAFFPVFVPCSHSRPYFVHFCFVYLCLLSPPFPLAQPHNFKSERETSQKRKRWNSWAAPVNNRKGKRNIIETQ